MNISSDKITSLKPDEVFVFGSNEGGRHGAGAAKQAMNWGAVYRQAFGLQGQTFAIPTLDEHLMRLPLDKIQYYINKFYDFAIAHPELKFLVTEIGCGLAGFSVQQIAPMFKYCKELDNVYLPRRFL